MTRPKTLKAAAPGLFRILRFLWPYAHRRRALVAGSFGALVTAVVFRALEPWPLKFVFDEIIVRATQSPADPDRVMLQLGFAAVSYLGIVGIRTLATYYQDVGFALVGNRVMTELRAALYRHLQGLSLSYHHRARKGDLVVRVIGDIGMLRDVAVTALMPLMASVLIIAIMMGLMYWLNWKLAVLISLTLPLYALPTVRLGGKIRDASRDQRKREGAMASTAAESMGAIHVVQALSLEERFSDQFSGENKKSLKDGVRQRRLSARLESTVHVMIAVSTALILWFGTRSVLQGSLTAGELLVFLSYLKAAFRPLQDFAKYAGRVAKASAAGERILAIFDRRADVADAPDAKSCGRLNGNVVFADVSFRYDMTQTALRNVSLDVPAGKRIALVGPSGNGKTTLLSLIPRLYDPTEGTVTIDGHDIRTLRLSSLRRNISMVLQDNLLFATSLRENIRLGSPEATDDQIIEAARLANCMSFLDRLPNGLDTEVGERGVTLSAGQRQRIAIARAAVRDAPILLLDEPTTSLDEKNARDVVDALERVGVGRTVFLVTHDVRLASRSDFIAYLEDGRVVEYGNHESLMAADGRYAALFQLQSREPLLYRRALEIHGADTGEGSSSPGTPGTLRPK